MTMVKGQKNINSFNNHPSTKALKELAKYPYDLTVEGNLTTERLNQFIGEGGGYRVLFGTERVTEEVMEKLYELAVESQAFEKMDKMQAGEIMNTIEGHPSEDRQVLHTAVRDFFDAPHTSPKAQEATKIAKGEYDKLEAFIKEIDKENKFTDLIMVGIGGSDLGPKANYRALTYLRRPNRRVHFISNVDPDDAANKLALVDLKNTLIGVVSKSGTTLETATNEALVRERFVKAGLNPVDHFVSITCEGTPMDDPSLYRECFHLWDWVGGRFSSSSMVGGLQLSFAYGFDVYREFLRGANLMDKVARERDVLRNIPLLIALLGVWNHNFLGAPTLAIVPYLQSLYYYVAHLQQVDMESNGKIIDRFGNRVSFETGPIIWGKPGTNAQHSFFQLLHQGTSVVPVEFIGFKETQYGQDMEFKGTNSHEKLLANMFAQSLALAEGMKDANPNKVFPGNRPSHVILSKKLDPCTLGSLLSMYEHKLAFQGFIWDINSFDQEGVQLGKVLADKIINRFAVKRGNGVDEKFPLGDALINQLDMV